jgi:hypothetical protein
VTYRESDIDEGGKPVDTTKATRLTDIETGDKLPFYSVPTGKKQSQIIGAPGEGDIRLDRETGLYQQWNGKAYVTLPQPIQMQIRFNKMREQGQGGVTPTPTPSPTPTPEPGSPEAPLPGSVLSRLFGGGRATPTPMPSPIIVPGGPATARPLTPQDQDALDWVRRNPNDPRAAAILAKLGITR